MYALAVLSVRTRVITAFVSPLTFHVVSDFLCLEVLPLMNSAFCTFMMILEVKIPCVSKLSLRSQAFVKFPFFCLFF